MGAIKNRHGIVHHDFLGVPISGITLDETIAIADQAMQDRMFIQHVGINVAKFVDMRTSAMLDANVRQSEIISADGMGILWAARLLGIGLQTRVAGIDLMDGLIKLCAERGYRPYLLGAQAEVVAMTVANFQTHYPAIKFSGWHDGYFSADEEADLVEQIRACRPDCLFVGMPSPKKEHFVARHHARLDIPFIMGVGGSLDVFSGKVRRAPKRLQKVGLEWMFRTAQEPRRLLPRYLKSNAVFAAIMVKALSAKYLRLGKNVSYGAGRKH